MSSKSIAIIGAGIAGLTCAKTLSRAGQNITLFDKARGPGGRMATRRSPVGNFDHGAQYFTVSDPAFRSEVDEWCQTGLAAPWDARLVRFTAGSQQAEVDSKTRYCGTPRMSSITRHLSDSFSTDIPQNWECRITSCTRDDEEWWLEDDSSQRHGPFSHLVMAIPGPQAAEILPSGGDIQQRLATCTYAPCWALLACFTEPLDVDFDVATADGTVAWLARDSSKPGREAGERWILHASVPWSIKELERSKEEAAALLIQAMTDLVGPLPEIQSAKAHRWRFARPEVFLGEDFAADPTQNLFAIGDHSQDARIEAAYVSGLRLGEFLLG